MSGHRKWSEIKEELLARRANNHIETEFDHYPYETTKAGNQLTPEYEQELVEEAERGIDLDT